MKQCAFQGTYHLTFLRIEKVGWFGSTPKPWFLFEIDQANPLTFITKEGTWIRPASHFETDMGSVPPEFQARVGPLDSPRGYAIHDSVFENHGWWESYDKGQTWYFVLKTEDDANNLLWDMAEADGVDWLEREEMHTGVDLGGSAIWNKHKGPFPVDPPPPGVIVQ